MLRSGLLWLSRQKGLRHWVETSRLTQGLTSRFVAGQTLEQCLQACQGLKQQGMRITLDYLGENISSLEEAQQSRDAYLASLARLKELQLPATVSIKLSQFGLELSEPACRKNVRELVERASRMGTRVEIDMEDSSTTDRTLAIVRDMHEEFGCVRAVIQAYLFRSEADIRDLNARKIPVRLCKGAYKESPEIAFEAKQDVDSNYCKLIRLLLEEGTFPAIATHDQAMVDYALAVVRERQIPSSAFEFQMLYGVRRDLQQRLVKDGFAVRSYVPYGNAWYPYFMRRLAERPANLLFILRQLLHA